MRKHPHEKTEQSPTVEAMVELFRICSAAIGPESRLEVIRAIRMNLSDVSDCTPSAEMAIKILIAIGGQIINEEITDWRERASECN